VAKHSFKKKWSWALPLVAVLLLELGFTPLHATSSPDLSKLTVPVQTQDLTIRVEASGSVVPLSTVNISPKTSGQLAALFVDQGDQVKAGQIVARMDSETLEPCEGQGPASPGGGGYEKVRTGSRSEEINIARAKVAAASTG